MIPIDAGVEVGVYRWDGEVQVEAHSTLRTKTRLPHR